MSYSDIPLESGLAQDRVIDAVDCGAEFWLAFAVCKFQQPLLFVLHVF